MNQIVVADANYPVQPDHINAKEHFFGAFNHRETEISAHWLVRFAQERKTGWEPFTLAEIEAFYAQKHSDGFTFNRLVQPGVVLADPAKEFGQMAEHVSLCGNMPPVIASIHYAISHGRPKTVEKGGGWIILRDGKYYFTHEFIASCYKSSPQSSPTETAPVVAQ